MLYMTSMVAQYISYMLMIVSGIWVYIKYIRAEGLDGTSGNTTILGVNIIIAMFPAIAVILPSTIFFELDLFGAFFNRISSPSYQNVLFPVSSIFTTVAVAIINLRLNPSRKLRIVALKVVFALVIGMLLSQIIYLIAAFHMYYTTGIAFGLSVVGILYFIAYLGFDIYFVLKLPQNILWNR